MNIDGPHIPQEFASDIQRAVTATQNYLSTGDHNTLSQAVVAWQHILDHPRIDDAPVSFRLAVLNGAGNTYQLWYHSTGNADDLYRALSLCQQALQLTSSSSSERVACLGSLAYCLSDLFFLTGDLADLEQAIGAEQQAVVLAMSLASPDLPILLSYLSDSLRERYSRTRNLDDLNQSVTLSKQAVKLTSHDSLYLSGFLNNLGNCWHDRYTYMHEFVDLQKAVAAYQCAVARSSPADSGRPKFLGNLGTALRERYAHTENPNDIEEAITFCEQSVRLTPPSSPHHPVRSNSLATALQQRYMQVVNPSDLERAITAFRQTCGQGLNTQLRVVLTASHNWGNWALERGAWQEAVQAFSSGHQAIARLLRTQTMRAGKESWLREAWGIFGRSAYAQAKCGELAVAVSTLESGRARLLSETLERNRIDLEKLKDIGRADLLERYRAASGRIVQLESRELRGQAQIPGSDFIAELRTTRVELDAVIAEIQQVPGYEDFFQAPAFEKIQCDLLSADVFTQAAVYITIAPISGLALIVHQGGIKDVWLDLTIEELNGWLLRHKDTIGGYLPAQMGAALNEVLPLLGEKVMQPIAEALNSLSVSNVTLIPCGRLAPFPLHAAEYRVDGQVRRFIEEFTVTYIPSARALGSSREALAAVPEQQPTLLAVGNPLPLPEKVKSLIFARPEVEEIAPLFNGQATVLYEQDATRSAVDAQLGVTTYLHLSCHGMFNPAEPLESGVVLSNGEMLTLKDLLARQRLSGTRLVVLSACQTAITDFIDLPEEAIGLPAGFLQAGVPGVVGTLWPVNDLSTALLMIKFYEYHLKGKQPPALALRQAQLWLRGVTNAELSELFSKYKMTAPDRPEQSRMAFELASERFREHTLRDPDERPFAHPYYWAPFVFYGV
ncbi:MAG TPA: CHAT domain-containing protein [Anaerolineae bacterium]|nr:CHAT domain-containing protein [Anaerolineae bacterium]